MAEYTNRLDLYKPGGGLSGTNLPDEVADIDKINGNMDLIDEAIGFFLCTSTTRPASPFEGQAIYERDTKATYVYVNGSWALVAGSRIVDWTPNFVGASVGNGTLTGGYKVVEGVCNYWWSWTLGTTSSISSTLRFQFPVATDLPADTPAGLIFLRDDSASGMSSRERGVVTATGSSTGATPFLNKGDVINATTPWTWAAGDGIVASGTYLIVGDYV